MSHRNDWSLLAQLDLLQLEDAELERRLLASAADDAPPASASERAFSALAADARALAALTALAPAPATERASPAPASPPARAAWRSALAGLMLGAVVGAGAVALWLSPGAAQRANDRAALVPPLPPRARVEPSAPELRPEPGPPLPAARQEPPSTPQRTLDRADARTAAERVASERASRLAREVAALDAARAALAIGAGQSTLRQIERYRAEFPDGELAADAEAVAIEALAIEGEHGALAAAAQRFLARHPRDPHAARVRELAFIKPPAPAP